MACRREGRNEGVACRREERNKGVVCREGSVACRRGGRNKGVAGRRWDEIRVCLVQYVCTYVTLCVLYVFETLKHLSENSSLQLSLHKGPIIILH